MNPIVLDIYHGDIIEGQSNGSYSGFGKIKAAGYAGIILKATQGINVADPEYAKRVKFLSQYDILPGAYHFNTGDKISSQVDQFFNIAKPTDKTLMAIDFEDNSKSEMTLNELIDFLTLGYAILKRRLWVYSGERIKSLIVHADPTTRNFLALHKFWLSEYGNVPKMIDENGKLLPWTNWTLWQRDADGYGPDAHNVPGMITPNDDLSIYNGNAQQLALDWIS